MRLFTRTARGAGLTIDGQAFLPHARELLRVEERAVASVRPGRRALRVDVIGRRLAPAAVLGDFHRAHPEVDLDVVTLFDADAAVDAIRSGTIDASFRAVTAPGRQLSCDIKVARAFDEPVQITDSRSLATFVGEQTRLVRPADHDLRRIAVRDPAPVYPHPLLWHRDNPHPALAALRDHLGSGRFAPSDAETWTPAWAQRPVPPRCPVPTTS